MAVGDPALREVRSVRLNIGGEGGQGVLEVLAQERLHILRTTATFSCDIAYSDSPTASRASARSKYSVTRTTRPSS